MEINRIKTRPPFSDLFLIDQRVFEAVKEDMGKQGFDPSQPIVLWDGEEVVIDGHTRLQAAMDLGLEEVPVFKKSFPDEDAALEYAIHNQRHRRNLTEADILRCIEAVDKRRERGGDRRSEGAKSKASNEAIERGKSAEETARIVGTSRAKVERARVVLADPQAATEVKAGEKKISRAYQEIQANRKTQHQSEPAKPQGSERQAILRKALSEIRPWREKYKDYPELSVIFMAIAGCHLNFGGMKMLPKAEEAQPAGESLVPGPPTDVEEKGEEPQLSGAVNDELPRCPVAVDSTDKPGSSFNEIGSPEQKDPAAADSLESGIGGHDHKQCPSCKSFVHESVRNECQGTCKRYPKFSWNGQETRCALFDAVDLAESDDTSPKASAGKSQGKL